VTLFVALLAGSLGAAALRDYGPAFLDSNAFSYTVSVVVSTLGIFAFLLSAYYVLTNDAVSVRDALPGAILATVLLEASFQVLPVYVRFTSLNPALRTFGGTAILLVWLYVMANVIVFGAELNWWYARRRAAPAADVPEPA
jgi:uncharacterized BrkB/YihY/UPF0761 family membrane protein